MLGKFKDFILNNMISILRGRGYYVSRPHFYNPIPDRNYLLSSHGYWKQPYPCHGIEFYDEEQLLLCEELSEYAPEIYELPGDIFNPHKNKSFLDMDLEFLYCMVRHAKPKRFIEIGAGWSSRIAYQALNKNMAEGYECEHILIDPYKDKEFESLFKDLVKFIDKPIQEVPTNIFKDLNKNDILFIDTSHISKYGSDVNYLYFHILPLVNSGCYIHIHDIFMPNDYPSKWIYEYDQYWTELYLVMALLMYNSEFKIRIAAQYLSQKYRERLNKLFPRFKSWFSPGSLWIQRK